MPALCGGGNGHERNENKILVATRITETKLIMDEDFEVERIARPAQVVFDSVRAKPLLESDVFWARASIGHIGHDQTSRSFRKRAIVELELP